MRVLVSVLAFFLAATISRGQEQETKLVDRLLRPNMQLENSAQKKSFTTRSAFIGNTVPVRLFHIPTNALAQNYTEQRKVSAREFMTRHFRDGDVSAPARPRTQIVSHEFSTASTLDLVRGAHDANRTVASESFAGTRPFLDRGKSEKALQTQNPPLTIEQVRELLNKNK